MLPVLDGVVMELQDCALPLLRGEENLRLSVRLKQVTVGGDPSDLWRRL